MGQNENLCCRGLSGGTWKEELDQGLLAAHQQNKITSKPTQTDRAGRACLIYLRFLCLFPRNDHLLPMTTRVRVRDIQQLQILH